MKVSKKVVVVTGAGSGIGRALVAELLARGAAIAAVDLSEEGLEETAKLHGNPPELSLHVANIADRERVEALPDEILAQHGAVDILINNAGIIQPFVPFAELDFEVIDRVLQVNLYGVIYMTRAFLPHLMEREEAHLINVSSMGGFMPFPGQTMYGASKAAVKLLTEGLYAELMETCVDVSVVFPGAVATNITTNSGAGGHVPEDAEDSLLEPLPAEDAARDIVDGIEKGRLHIFVGKDSKLLNMASRIAPQKSVRFIQKQMKKRLQGDRANPLL